MAKKLNRRADGLVEIKKTVAGKRRSFYGQTKREAEEKWLAAVDQQGIQRSFESDRFDTVADAWWIYQEKRVKAGSFNRSYKANFERVKARFGQDDMESISPQQVRLWLESLAMQGLAEKTAGKALSVLRLIFKFWRLESGSTHDPCRDVSVPRGMKKSERLPPTPEQLAAIAANEDGFGFAAKLFRYTGLRLGEAIGLQWQDIDFDAGLISVTKSCTWVGNRPMIQAPKSKSSIRQVPIMPQIEDDLRQRCGQPEEYVLSGRSTPLSQREYNNAWSKYCHSIGLAEIKKVNKRGGSMPDKIYEVASYKPLVTAHQLRHEFCTMLYRAGVPVLTAQKIMGHSDPQITMRIYTNLDKSDLQSARDILRAYKP